MPAFDVISIGSAFDDLFVRSDGLRVSESSSSESGQVMCMPLGAKLEVQSLKHEVGGGGANTSVSLARLGYKTALLARVGADLAGQHVRDVVSQEGVDLSHVVSDVKRNTGESVILLSGDGNRTLLAYRGAGTDFATSEIAEEWLRQTDWMYLSGIGGHQPSLSKIFGIAHLYKIKMAWNPGTWELDHGLTKLAPWVQQTDLLILNREEAAKLLHVEHITMDVAAHQLMKLVNRGTVVITDGSHGAIAFDGEQLETIGAASTTVVDATGAGDSFGSAFLGAHLAGVDLNERLRWATLNAESVIGRVGGQTGLLRRDELVARLGKTS